MSELGPEARAILAAGRDGDDPSSADRARVRRALMMAIAAGAASTAGEAAAQAGTAKAAAASAAKASLSLGSAWKAVFGLAILGSLGGGLAIVVSSSPQKQSAPAAAPAPAVSAPADIAEEQPRQEDPPPPVAPEITAQPAPEEKPKAPHSLPPPGARPSAAASAAPRPAEEKPPEDPLVAETRALREAHGALNGGDPSRALALLDEQSTTYTDGKLREERAAARILSLCKLGRVDEARAEAARFLQENPRSPLAARVRGACATGR
jgi:hypothetical protein